MPEYLREIIYLQKVENGLVQNGAGSVRLERKRGLWYMRLVGGAECFGSPAPVYMVYERDGILIPVSCGVPEEQGWDRGTPLSPADPGALGESGHLCGILIGGPERYLAGTCRGCGGELRYEMLSFPEEAKQESREGSPAPSPGEESLEAASAPEMPAQEPERGEDLLFRKLSEMYPFEDDEMDWCRQMEPEDFASLPMDYWHYAKNSFLLHGFYNYRHLLYAGSRGKKYIGVPGQFHRREQYLASRFGFPRFKGTRRKKVTMGDFGYWLKEV